jgi:hypothetical protein
MYLLAFAVGPAQPPSSATANRREASPKHRAMSFMFFIGHSLAPPKTMLADMAATGAGVLIWSEKPDAKHGEPSRQ